MPGSGIRLYRHPSSSASFFKIVFVFGGYCHPEKIVVDNENKYFLGDLTDVPAKTEPPPSSIHFYNEQACDTHSTGVYLLKIYTARVSVKHMFVSNSKNEYHS